MSNTTETIAKLTSAGREFMLLVGQLYFDFFDEGIVEDSGNWGENLADQAARKMGKTHRAIAGVMSRLASPELGLWTLRDEEDYGSQMTWWSLTELGAAVANELASVPQEPIEGTTEDLESGWSDAWNGRPARFTEEQNRSYAFGYRSCEENAERVLAGGNIGDRW